MNKIVCIAVLLCTAYVNAADPDWDKLISNGDAAELVQVIENQGPTFKIDASLMDKLCGKPQLIQAVLDHLYGELTVVTATTAAEAPAPTPRPGPTTLRAGDPERVLSLFRNLEAVISLGDSGESRARQMEARESLTRFIMNPVTNLKGMDTSGYPDWVQTLIKQADLARQSKLPTLKFKASRSLSFSEGDRVEGISAYFSLFMVKSKPSGNQAWNLETELLAQEDNYMLDYDTKTKTFEPSPIGEPRRTIFRLGKHINDGLYTLFPGTWAIRFKYTTGRGGLRMDQTELFDLEPGKTYTLGLDLKRIKDGRKVLSLDLEEN